MDVLTQQMNSVYASIVYPNTVIKGASIVLGCSGNVLVFLVYTIWIPDRDNIRYFIPFLAIVDALGSLFQGRFYLVADIYAFIFPSDVACRLLYFVFTSLSGISAHCLLVMALQRFLFICRPFGRQMSLLNKRLSLVFISLASGAYAIPLLFYSGVKEETISFRGQNFTAFICRVVVHVSSSSTAYVTMLFLLTLVNVILTSVLYIPVCKTMFRASKSIRTTSQRESSSVDPRQPDKSNSRNIISEEVIYGENRDAMKVMIGKPKTNAAMSRISVMFFIVILVYIISYIPSFIVILINHTLKEFDPLQLSDVGLNTWRFFNTTSLFNHVSNPFIYLYYDKKFRKALDKLIGRRTSKGHHSGRHLRNIE